MIQSRSTRKRLQAEQQQLQQEEPSNKVAKTSASKGEPKPPQNEDQDQIQEASGVQPEQISLSSSTLENAAKSVLKSKTSSAKAAPPLG